MVLGCDLISPLGIDLEQTWGNILRGRCGLRYTDRPSKFTRAIAGEIPALDFQSYPFLTNKEQKLWFNPIISYSQIVAFRALKKINLDLSETLGRRTAITFTSTIGGVESIIKAHEASRSLKQSPHAFTNPNGCLNMIAGKISILTGARGPIFSPVGGSTTGLLSIIQGTQLIKENLCDLAICGSADLPIFNEAYGAFKNAQMDFEGPPSRTSSPDNLVRPYSKDRIGGAVSEGAGCVVLASASFCQANGLRPSIEISGHFSNANHRESFEDLKASRIECLNGALSSAQISPREIDYINGFGEATEVGDRGEASVLKGVFPEAIPPLASNKGQLGTALGTAALLETILTIRCMEEGILLPTANYTPDPDLGIASIVRELGRKVISNAMKYSFDKSNNACLVLKNKRNGT